MKRTFVIAAAAAILFGQAALAQSPAPSDGGIADPPLGPEQAEAARDLLKARRDNAARQRAGDPAAVWMAFGRPEAPAEDAPAK